MIIAWRDLAIEVIGAPSVLTWLESFLCPSFARVDASPSARIRVAIGDISGTPSGEHLDCFTLDDGHVRLPIVATARGPAAFDATARALLHRTPEGGDVVLAADDRLGRIFVLRVVRELASAYAIAAGDLPLHSSAVEHGGRAWLFVGPKNAGKTSLAIYALGQPDVRLIANDRVFAQVEDDGAIARGMPTIIGLRVETLSRFPGAAERIAIVPTPLAPALFAAALGAGLTNEAPIAAIILVASTRDTASRIEPAPDAAATLAAHGLIAGGALAASFAPPSRPSLDARLAALTARVPCRRLVLGPDAYATPSLWRALVAG